MVFTQLHFTQGWLNCKGGWRVQVFTQILAEPAALFLLP